MNVHFVPCALIFAVAEPTVRSGDTTRYEYFHAHLLLAGQVGPRDPLLAGERLGSYLDLVLSAETVVRGAARWNGAQVGLRHRLAVSVAERVGPPCR